MLILRRRPTGNLALMSGGQRSFFIVEVEVNRKRGYSIFDLTVIIAVYGVQYLVILFLRPSSARRY